MNSPDYINPQEKATTMKPKSESHTNKGKVYITFQLSPEANALLNQASEQSGRAKTQEAKLRLEDHLENNRSIARIGLVEVRNDA